jgi:hypothetical protein
MGNLEGIIAKSNMDKQLPQIWQNDRAFPHMRGNLSFLKT